MLLIDRSYSSSSSNYSLTTSNHHALPNTLFSVLDSHNASSVNKLMVCQGTVPFLASPVAMVVAVAAAGPRTRPYQQLLQVTKSAAAGGITVNHGDGCHST